MVDLSSYHVNTKTHKKKWEIYPLLFICVNI